jgi:hypothetical protein
MVACFRNDCHQCWQQRAVRGHLDHYDDFDTLDACWLEAFEEAAEQTPIAPFDDGRKQLDQRGGYGEDDGLAFVVLDIDSDDDMFQHATTVKK